MGEDKSSKKEKKSKKKEKKTEDEEPKADDAGSGGDDAPKEEPKRAQRATSNVFALFNQSQIQEFKEAFTMIDQNRDGIIDTSDLAAIYQQIGLNPDEASMLAMLKEAPGQLNFTHFLTLFGEKLHGREADPKIMDSMLKESPGQLNFTAFLALFGEKLHGRDPDPKILEAMIADSPGQLNFTHFLTLFGEKLHGRDPQADILQKMVDESPGPLNFTMFLGLFGDKLKGTDPESTLRDAFIMFDEDKSGKLGEEYFKDLLMNVGDPFSKDEIKGTWKEAPIEGGELDYLKLVHIIKRGKEDE